MIGDTASGMGEVETGWVETTSQADLLDHQTDKKPEKVPFPIPFPVGCNCQFEYQMIKRGTLYNMISVFCLIIFICCVIGSTQIKWSAYQWRFYVGMALFMVFCVIIAELNRWNKFHTATAWCYQWRYVLMSVFLSIAVIDFVILGISDVPEDCDWDNKKETDCPNVNPDKNGIRYITRSLTIIAGVLFVMTCLGYWEKISYFSAHSTWVQSLLYMTIIGWMFTHVARCCEPPPPEEEQELNWSWHQPHSSKTVSNNVVKIMIFYVLFAVIMGTLVLAIFADVATATGALGVWVAIFLFFIIAMIISIMPLAPGSVIDVCAGFLFVTLFVTKWSVGVPASFGLALGLTIIIHFVGSCSQYYVGKMRFVQIWANRSLPPEMLAASDSVLKEANWFKVGIVGQVFMDTANGLNQGRMNMAFCTQFWSEFASIPNAISLVALGTVLAIPSLDGGYGDRFSWAEDAIPLVLMVVTMWQMAASSWGAKELLSSAHKPSYWCALEKWNTAQYFYRLGYVPTVEGWNEDVFELAKSRGMNEECLFYKVRNLQIKKVSRRKTDFARVKAAADRMCSAPTDPKKARRRMCQSKMRSRTMKQIRQTHFDAIEPKLDSLVDAGFLVTVEKDEPKASLWDNAEENCMMRNLQQLLTMLIFFTGLGCYSYIASDISLSESVKKGINVLGSVPTGGWVCFAVFWIAVFFYYQKEMAYACGEMGDLLHFIFVKRLAVNPDWESEFASPEWQIPQADDDDEEDFGPDEVAEAASEKSPEIVSGVEGALTYAAEAPEDDKADEAADADEESEKTDAVVDAEP